MVGLLKMCSQEEIIKLIWITEDNLNVGDYPLISDQVYKTLEEKGLVKYSSFLYCFTDEGERLTKEFINYYSPIVKKELEKNKDQASGLNIGISDMMFDLFVRFLISE